MRALSHKMIRDVGRSSGVLGTICLIISIGVGSFVGLMSGQRILEESQAAYYDEYRFADFWVDVKKVPLDELAAIADLPGVAAVEPRIVFDVILDLPATIKPIAGRLISTPPRGFAGSLNGICLIRGSGFSDDRDEEVIVSEAFAKEHDLQPGDHIKLILNRKRESFVIVGTAISPEFVYMVRGEGDFVPDPQNFGILYVKEAYAREVLDFQDACNQIVGRLVSGADVDIELLLERIDRMLAPYGVLATTPRERQASNRFLSDEIRGLGVTAAIMPTIFLLVAALVLNFVMSRLAERQRTIIGTFKALGYSDAGVLWHFVSFGLVVGIVGGLAGNLVGILLAKGLVALYKTFFQFPTFAFHYYADLLAFGVALSVVFAVAGTARGVWKVLKLQPAEAMRPKPPARGGAMFLERFPALWRRLGFRSHIALRSVARNRGRTLTGIFSSALAVAIIMTSLALYEGMDFLVRFQFEALAHSDVDIGMRDEKSAAALLEARALPGVDYAEPLLGLTCDLRRGPYSRRVTITGLAQQHRLTTPVQAGMRPVQVPPSGLVVSDRLAEVLNAGVGDRLELTPVRGDRQTTSVPLVSVVESYIGLACYADQRYLSRIVGEAQAVNAIQVSLNPAQGEDFYRTLKKLPNAQGLSVQADVRANIEKTVVLSTMTTISFLIVFAGLIAFGYTLNASLIEIGDSQREIATFRVLGYRPGQIAGIFFRQSLLVFLLALPPAFAIGYLMVIGSSKGYDTDLFRLPVVLHWRMLLLTGLLAFAFVLAAQWLAYRQVKKLDWLEGIKTKE